MLRRVSGADRAAAIGVAIGVIASFIPWYSYNAVSAHVTVNGFRASVLGDLFFLAVTATGVLLLMRAGVIDDVVNAHLDERQALTVLAAVAVGAVLLQLIVDAMGGGRSIAFGFVLAVLAAGLLGAAAWLQRPRPEARLTVRQMLEEDRLP
jgi:hypothetical protein